MFNLTLNSLTGIYLTTEEPPQKNSVKTKVYPSVAVLNKALDTFLYLKAFVYQSLPFHSTDLLGNHITMSS